MRYVTPILILLGLAAASPAGRIIPGGNSHMMVTDPERVGDGSEELWRVIVSIVGQHDGMPGAFDGSFAGKLHQQDVFGLPSPTIDDPIPGTNLTSPIDTHFLVSSGDLLRVDPPNGFGLTENVGLEPSSEPPDATGPVAPSVTTSFGSHLAGTWALFEPPSTVLPLAQIVGPAGFIDYNFVVNVVGLPEAVTERAGQDPYTGSFFIPEPSSSTLVVLIVFLGGASLGASRATRRGGHS